MKTLDIEIALMSHYYGAYIVVPRVHIDPDYNTGSSFPYEADIILLNRKSNYATEIEIKVSKSDLIKDKDKKHNHDSNLFSRLYFAVPKDLYEIALEHVPDKAGILVIYKYRNYYKVIEKRRPKRNTMAVPLSPYKEKWLLMAAYYKILPLHRKIKKLSK